MCWDRAGPRLIKKKIHRAAVSQRLRNTGIGGWEGPRTGLDECGKSRLHLDSTVQPVASRYTD
jgi:hypothetical protein